MYAILKKRSKTSLVKAWRNPTGAGAREAGPGSQTHNQIKGGKRPQKSFAREHRTQNSFRK